MRSRLALAVVVVLGALVAAACAGSGSGTGGNSTGDDPTGGDGAATRPSGAGSETTEQRYPDIVDVEITPAGDQRYDLAVTVSSPYDTPARYADGWRVLAPDGTELGIHTLLHDHANEQPFTRTQTGVEIPTDVAEVTVEGHDQRYGFGGETVTVTVPHDA